MDEARYIVQESTMGRGTDYMVLDRTAGKMVICFCPERQDAELIAELLNEKQT